MLNSAKIIQALQRKCAICEKIRLGLGPRRPLPWMRHCFLRGGDGFSQVGAQERTETRRLYPNCLSKILVFTFQFLYEVLPLQDEDIILHTRFHALLVVCNENLLLNQANITKSTDDFLSSPYPPAL